MNTMIRITALLIASLALPALAASKAPPEEKRWGDITVVERKDIKIVISDDEREVIREHYTGPGKTGKKGKRIPPGLQKKGTLPPGWQKKMDRGEVVPDDVWAQREPLPYEVIRRLPPQPDGVVTVRIEGKVARVVEATRVILDVFDLY